MTTTPAQIGFRNMSASTARSLERCEVGTVTGYLSN
jgi:hypothetical protein